MAEHISGLTDRPKGVTVCDIILTDRRIDGSRASAELGRPPGQGLGCGTQRMQARRKATIQDNTSVKTTGRPKGVTAGVGDADGVRGGDFLSVGEGAGGEGCGGDGGGGEDGPAGAVGGSCADGAVG